MTNYGWVRTGRVDTRKVCTACGARIRLGEPKPTSTWPARLHLTDEQLNLLLVAAAEFVELGPESAVAFVDWVTGVSRQSGIVGDHDGAPPRHESGGFAGHAHYNHRHPFPLPEASLPRGWRREQS